MAVDIAAAVAAGAPPSEEGRESPNSVELSLDSHGRKLARSKSSASKGGSKAGSKAGSKSSSSKSSKRQGKSQWDEDMAAMRHLRQIVESIAGNEYAPPEQRKQKIAEMEEMFTKAEKKLHFKDGRGDRMDEDPLGHLPAKAAKGKEKGAPAKRRGWLKAARLLGKQGPKSNPEAIEIVAEDGRGDADALRGSIEEVRVEAEADDATATDSIIDLRNQNSEDYVASVCSLRSLGTFEKDFITNIIAEQRDMDEISQSTFEKDFLARQAHRPAVPPTQVFVNADDVSETTFEQDAGVRGAAAAPAVGATETAAPPQLPMQVVTNTHDPQDDVDDDLTVGTFQSETTYERDQRLKGEHQRAVDRADSAPTAFAVFDTLPDDGFLRTAASADSVSTFEKDAAALSRLAAKIGRTPSTKAKATEARLAAKGSAGSEGTFEKDMGVRRPRAQPNALGNAAGVAANGSDISTGTFEQDMGVRGAKAKLSTINEAQSALSRALSRASSARPPAVATGTGTVAAPQSMLSPMTVDTTGVLSPMSDNARSPACYHPSNLTDRGNNPGWFNSNQAAIDGVSGDNGAVFEGNANMAALNASVAASPTRRVGTGLSAAALAANAEAAEAAAQKSAPKISPLVVELSPNAIDRGVKSTQRDGIWGRLLCQTGLGG